MVKLNVDLASVSDLSNTMLMNNCSIVVLVHEGDILHEHMRKQIMSTIDWLAASDEDDEWAVFQGDKDIFYLPVKEHYSSEMVMEAICLADSIFIVDPTMMPETARRITPLLLRYQEMVIKEVLDAAITDDNTKKSSKEKEIEDYQDELFTTISKRRLTVIDKCFNIYEVDQINSTIQKIN